MPGDTYRVAEITPEGKSTYATTGHVSQLKSWKVYREDEDSETLTDPADNGADSEEADNSAKPLVEFRVRERKERKAPKYLKDFVPKRWW